MTLQDELSISAMTDLCQLVNSDSTLNKIREQNNVTYEESLMLDKKSFIEVKEPKALVSSEVDRIVSQIVEEVKEQSPVGVFLEELSDKKKEIAF